MSHSSTPHTLNRRMPHATFSCSLGVCILWLLAGLALSLPARPSIPANTPPELVVQTGHSSRVTCAVFGPDGSWIASGSADNTIRLWDTASGRELRALVGHKNWIRSLAVSNNGKLLASGSNDQTAKIWNVASGRELFTLDGAHGPVEALAFSRDDRWLATGGNDGKVRLWDVQSGAPGEVLSDYDDAVTVLGFSPDGNVLVVGTKAGSISLTHRTTPVTRTLKKMGMTTVAFSPNGLLIGVGLRGGAMLVLQGSGGRVDTIQRGSSAVLAMKFRNDDEIVSVSTNGKIVTTSAKTGKELSSASLDMDVDELVFACLSPDTTTAATSIGNRLLELRNTSNGLLSKTLESHAAGFFAVAFSADGRWLASGTSDRSIRLWQIATGREMPKLSGHTGWVKSVAFSPDSRLLASGSNSGEVKLWDPNTGREIFGVSYPQERIHTIAFSSDGKWVAAGGTGQVIRLLEVAGRRSENLAGHSGEITSLAFLPNTSRLVSGSTDMTVRTWDATTKQLIKPGVTLEAPVNALAVSPDGNTVAAGTAGKKIVMLNSTDESTRTLAGHTGEIFSLAFSPDGRWLASGGMERGVRLWDAKTGAAGNNLTGANTELNGLAFSTDSRSLVSANGDGSMMVWGVNTGLLNATLVSVPLSDDWLVAAPNGSFDGSHAAWKLLLWRFGQDTFKVAPVESFFSEFYYPGLLSDVLAGKNPKASADIISKDRRQPEIRISSTEPSGDLRERKVRLKLEVSEAPADSEHSQPSGARDLRLFRNGLLVQTWSGDVLNGRSRQIIETTAQVVAGRNEFSAYAFNRDNVKSADSQLRLNGAESLRRSGTAYLIVVGVGTYENTQFNLNYSVADANAIAEQLKRQQESLGRYRPIEVISLLNEEATKANILLTLRLLGGLDRPVVPKDSPASLLKIKPAEPEDAILFYFSGHGTALGDRFYLLPHDIGYLGQRSQLDIAGIQSIAQHSISDLELEDALKDVDVDQMLLVIDACNSGQALQAQETRRGPMNTRGLAQLAYEKGMYVLTASQSDEVAFESAGLKHSYLAHALVVEGIQRGAADTDSNGQVILKEWFDYVTERVPRIGREKNQTGKQLEEVDADELRVQRPRVFNMREGGAERFVVARLNGGRGN